MSVELSTCGNGCGHDLHDPKLDPINYVIPKNLPLILQKVITRVREYYYDPSILPNLTQARRFSTRNMANKSTRCLRSERREAITRLLILLLSMTDLKSLKIGFTCSKTGRFVVPDCSWFAEKTGLTEQRVHRAMSDLKKSGMITITERAVAKKGRNGFTAFRARAAVRCFSKEVFLLLGISAYWLQKEQDSAISRFKDKLRFTDKSGWIGVLFKSLSGKHKKKKKIIENEYGAALWRPKSKQDYIDIQREAILLIRQNSYLQTLPDEVAMEKAKDKVIQRMMGIRLK